MADVSKNPAARRANKGRFEALNALDSAKFSKAHVKAILGGWLGLSSSTRTTTSSLVSWCP
ncbi:hypothetical protein PINS_up022431 [Pythium insidiosum]|nr:hypothetical protein PINS_up022431 [Pythium insidiosum]